MTSDKHVKRNLAGWTVGLVAGWMLVGSASAQDHDNIPYLPTTPRTFSTIPVNGDVNPYGVAFVPKGFATGGLLAKGDILVSNFNNNRIFRARAPPSCG